MERKEYASGWDYVVLAALGIVGTIAALYLMFYV
jgi:hypothetical protein